MNYLKFYKTNSVAKLQAGGNVWDPNYDPDAEYNEEQLKNFVQDRERWTNDVADLAKGKVDNSKGMFPSKEVVNLPQAGTNTGVEGFDPSMKGASGGMSAAGWGKVANVGVQAAQAVDNALMGDKNFGAQSQAIDTAVHGASKALISSGNPYAMAAGAALEAANFVTKAGGQTVQGFDVDINSSGYGNMGHKESSSSRDFGAILGLGGLNQGAMQRKLAKRNEEAQMAMKAANVADTIKFEQEARMNSVDDVIEQNQIALAGGIDTTLLAARHGAKLEKLKLQKKEEIIYHEPEEIIYEKEEPEIVKAQNGAKLEQIEVSDQQNVIPSGAMHKNKNHLDLDVTQKGIPVITVEDDSAETFEDIKEQEDTLVQHAEVEEAEIIFNKELTIFLENLRKQWHESDKKDDNICLEAGMRLAKEIVTNTEDNTDVTEKSIKAIENEDN